VEIVRKLSHYAQVDYKEKEQPEFKNNFLIGKYFYLLFEFY